ncbi:hypothetical protein [Neoaquamicrobium sediminum]|uniref:hypothetical protein n=1 Tax=Neoaquamicrobium sediminum TaxID=1849104 RepID=UPI0015652243|nr:hypothetical protein [Mesorhizobium sediminum]NRC55355.1 hypothetical protein [Mesorhizobium sediminum]
MDWNAAIETNREALRRVLAMLVAMVGSGPLGGTKSPETGLSGERTPEAMAGARPTLPRYLHRAVLALLRPAEAAARRLVIIVARDLAAPPSAPRLGRRSAARGGAAVAAPRHTRPLCLPLFDPLPRWNRRHRPAAAGMPRISFPGFTTPQPIPHPPNDFDRVGATRLAARLAALGRALDDLPRQATRFARWRDARDVRRRRLETGASRRIGRVSALRPGRPPGLKPARRDGWAHEVHAVLDTVHGLAFWALEPADTS